GVRQNPVQPRLEVRARLVLVESGIGLRIGLLDEVLGVGGIASHPQCSRIQLVTYSKASRSKRSDLSAAVSGTSLTDSVIAVNDTPVLSRTAVALMDNSFCLSIRDGAHPPFGFTCATSDRGPTIPRTAVMLASEMPAT